MDRAGRRHRAGIRLLNVWLAGLLLCAGAAAANPVPAADDLQRLGAEVRATATPLVLVVWAHDCPYCAVLDREILRPLQASGELEGRALLRRLDLDTHSLRDFAGMPVSAWEFAGRYRARVTPTVLFLDAEGNELTERLVGINAVDLYPAYLDRAIELATRALRGTPAEVRPRP